MIIVAVSLVAQPAVTATSAESPGNTSQQSDSSVGGDIPEAGFDLGANDGSSESSNVTSVRLLTGQTVHIVSQGGTRQYQIDADVEMRRIDTTRGTYIYPAETDFSTFDIDLFNVDLLAQQGLTVEDDRPIPLIVTSDGQGGRSVEDTGRTLESTRGVGVERQLDSVGAVAVEVDPGHAATVADGLVDARSVERVSLDVRYQVSLDDANNVTNASLARREYNVTGEGVTVAVVDTGVDATHPALDGNTVVLAKDFTGEGTTADLTGHGTHVAGIITADPNSGNGDYSGIAPDARIQNIRVLGSDGTGKTSDIIAGMDYAVNNGADVLSMSLGGPQEHLRSNDPFRDAIHRAVSAGVPVVVAAGNGGPDRKSITSPGVVSAAITVGATDDAGGVTDFSGRGPTDGFYLKPDLVAPGDAIVSAEAGTEGYIASSGTSMSTPMVSAAAALVLEKYPGWGPDRVRNALVSTSDPRFSPDVYVQGAGELDVRGAVAPGVVVDNSTIDVGRYTDNESVTRTLHLRNLANTSRTVNLSVSAEETSSGREATVSLNRSTVPVPANGSAVVNLTVRTGEPGVYGGRVTVNGSEATAVFGWVRGYNLTVRKEGLRGTSTAGDPVYALANTAGVYRNLSSPVTTFANDEDAVSYFVVDPGTYTVGSFGVTEDTETPVVVTREVNISGNTDVVLAENATLVHKVSTANLTAHQGPLDTAFVGVEFRVGTGGQTVRGALDASSPESTAIRLSASDTLNVSEQRVLVPASNRTARFNVSSFYHLIHASAGISSGRTYAPDSDELVPKRVDYYRTHADQRYGIELYARPRAGIGVDQVVVASGMVGDRENQTVYLNGQVATHSLDAVNRTDVTAPDWQVDGNERQISPGTTVVRQDVLRPPFHGALLEWSAYYDPLLGNVFTFQVAPQATGGRGPGAFADVSPDRVTVRFDGQVVLDTSTTSGTYRNGATDVPRGTVVNVTTVAETRALAHGRRTVTHHFGSYSLSGDGVPPRVDTLAVNATTSLGVAPNGRSRGYLSLSDDSDVSTVEVWYATGDVSVGPFDGNADDWKRANVTALGDGRWRFTLDTGTHEGHVSLAVAAADENDNRVRSTTYDAFRVADRPPNATAELATRKPWIVNETLRFDGTTSRDNLGIDSYRWTFGDGTTTNGSVVNHTYAARGTYEVTLTVTDTAGNTDTATVTGVEVTERLARLNASAASATAGENATVPFALTNVGSEEQFTLNVTAPSGVTVDSVSDDGGSWSADRTTWTFDAVGPNQTVAPNLTVVVPDDRTEPFDVRAVAVANGSVVARATATVTPCESVTEAIDADDDGYIGDFEMLDAIEYWRDGTEVPGTCGETIGDFEVLDIIELWREGSEV